jgi:hypothetical protein
MVAQRHLDRARLDARPAHDGQFGQPFGDLRGAARRIRPAPHRAGDAEPRPGSDLVARRHLARLHPPSAGLDNESHLERLPDEGERNQPATADQRLLGRGPVISPDETQIAFYRYRGTNVDPHVYGVNSNGGPAHRLLAGEAAPHAWLAN